jgi:hypothetical protein
VSSISTLTRKKGERGGNGSRSHPTMLLKEGCAIKEHPSEAFVDGADEETFLVEVSVDGVTLRFTPHAWARCRQRAVPLWAVSLALEVAPVFHHGDFVYCLTDRFLLERGLNRFIGRLRGLTVVVRRDGVIRTVKWDFRKREKGCWRRRNRINWTSISRRWSPRRQLR